MSCGASSCHGGAGEIHRQNTVWSKLDYHSRAQSTLTTARSARIGEALKIQQPVEDARCTVCHAPMHDLPTGAREAAVQASEGVSCENCHGAGETWYRSHTRKDYVYADRVQAGMRDLKSLYTRANTCVACHQHVDAALLKAGHPELIFELDGQAVSEPKHWREAKEWSGAQAWLVGQAVALRESSWHLTQEKPAEKNATARWQALAWLVQKAAAQNKDWPAVPVPAGSPSAEQLKAVQEAADQLAMQAAHGWPRNLSMDLLHALAESGGEFAQAKPSREMLARRGELLVPALERLTLDTGAAPGGGESGNRLKALFNDVQILPDFNPADFGRHLQEFKKSLPDK